MKADKRRSLRKTLSKYSPLVEIVKRISNKQEVFFFLFSTFPVKRQTYQSNKIGQDRLMFQFEFKSDEQESISGFFNNKNN